MNANDECNNTIETDVLLAIGASGMPPKAGENGNWFVYNNDTMQWEDTGYKITSDITEAQILEITQNVADIVKDEYPNRQYIHDNYATIESLENKADISDVPINNNQLVNGANYITAAVSDLVNYYKKSDTFTQSEVRAMINSITTINFLTVSSLPSQGNTTTIYLLKREDDIENNVYEEWIWVNGKWDLIGTTEADLSNYYTITQIDSILQIIRDEFVNYYTKVEVNNINQTLEARLNNSISQKVDKVQNKGLSANDYSNEEKALVSTISNKVDKVIGKYLSTNDYTNTDKQRVEAIPFLQKKLIAGIDIEIDETNPDEPIINYSGNGGGTGEKIQFTVLPTPTEELLGKIYQYIGANGLGLNNITFDGYYFKGNYYICSETKKGVYAWLPINNAISTDALTASTELPNGTIIYNLKDTVYNEGTENEYYRNAGSVYTVQDGNISLFRRSANEIPSAYTMPEASIEYFETRMQYVGLTNETYTFGDIYVCRRNGSYPNFIYFWNILNQSSGGSGGGGDMYKAEYDKDNSGAVENTKRLGGQLPDYYATSDNLTKEIADRQAADNTLTQSISTVSTSLGNRGQIWSLEELNNIDLMGNSGLYLIRDGQNAGEAKVVLQPTGISTQTYYAYDGKVLYRETPNFTWGEWQDITPASGVVEWKVDTMPTANEDSLGRVVTYIGAETLYAYNYFKDVFFRKTEGVPSNGEPSFNEQGIQIGTDIYPYPEYRAVLNYQISVGDAIARYDLYDIVPNRTYICKKIGNFYIWVPLEENIIATIAPPSNLNYTIELSENVYYKININQDIDKTTLIYPSYSNSPNTEVFIELIFENGGGVSFPANIKFATDPVFAMGKTYQISIVNNLAVIGEWSNE